MLLTLLASGAPAPNLLADTEELDLWSVNNATITTNVAAGPAAVGGTTADLLTENTATAAHSVLKYTAASYTGTFTGSIFGNSSSRDFVIQIATATGGVYAYFGNAGGFQFGGAYGTGITLVSQTAASAGGGWWRFAITATISASSQLGLYCALSSAGTDNYLGNGTSGAYLVGGQVNAGAAASIYQRNPAPSGALTGTIPGTSALSATLTGSGALVGTLPGTSSLAGALSANGALSGTIPVSSALSGSLTGAGALGGTVPGSSSLAGTLTNASGGSGALTGTIPGSSNLAGVLAGSGALTGSIPGSSTLTATLSGAGALSGLVPGASSLTGTLRGAGALSGTLPGTSRFAGPAAVAARKRRILFIAA